MLYFSTYYIGLSETEFLFCLCLQGQNVIWINVKVGALRVVDDQVGEKKRISPIFILPEHQNRGIAQKAMKLCEDIHGCEKWELDTIMQEEGNCYLYEKMGYHRTGKSEVINDKLTLVFYEK